MSVNETATYYMVEMDYPHETAAQRETFDAYYWRHIDMLLTIPGFMTAQRFHCADTDRAPFLALYRLSGPEVLTSEAYMSKAGRMSVHPDFREYISDWDRNLVQGRADGGEEGGGAAMDGPDLATAMDDTLVLIDRLTPDAAPLARWYRSAGRYRPGPDDCAARCCCGQDRSRAGAPGRMGGQGLAADPRGAHTGITGAGRGNRIIGAAPRRLMPSGESLSSRAFSPWPAPYRQLDRRSRYHPLCRLLSRHRAHAGFPAAGRPLSCGRQTVPVPRHGRTH